MNACKGCGHPLAMHVRNVEDNVICLCVEHGRSSGVIMDYHQECDCLNHVSQSRLRMEEEIEREREERRKDFEERYKEFKARSLP